MLRIFIKRLSVKNAKIVNTLVLYLVPFACTTYAVYLGGLDVREDFYSLAYDYTWFWGIFAFPLYLLIHEYIFREFSRWIGEIHETYLGKGLLNLNWRPPGVWEEPIPIEIDGQSYFPKRRLEIFVAVALVNATAIVGFGVASRWIDTVASPTLTLHWWWLSTPNFWIMILYLLYGSSVLFPNLVVRIFQTLELCQFVLQIDKAQASPLPFVYQQGRFFGLARSARLSLLLASTIWLFGGVLIFCMWIPVFRYDLFGEYRMIYSSLLPFSLVYVLFSACALVPLLLANQAAIARRDELALPWLELKGKLSEEIRRLPIQIERIRLVVDDEGQLRMPDRLSVEDRQSYLSTQIDLVNTQLNEIRGLPEWPFRRRQFVVILIVQLLPWAISTGMVLVQALNE